MTAHCGPIKRMARGGMFQGPGTGTSDSIPAQLPTGSFVEPAHTTARVSNGEAGFTPQEEQALGASILEMLRQMVNRPAKMAPAMGKGAPSATPFGDAAKGYKKGGMAGYAEGGVVDPNSPLATYQRASAIYQSMSAPPAPAPAPAATPAPTAAPATGTMGIYERASRTYQDMQRMAPGMDASGPTGGLHFAEGGLVDPAYRDRMAATAVTEAPVRTAYSAASVPRTTRPAASAPDTSDTAAVMRGVGEDFSQAAQQGSLVDMLKAAGRSSAIVPAVVADYAGALLPGMNGAAAARPATATPAPAAAAPNAQDARLAAANVTTPEPAYAGPRVNDMPGSAVGDTGAYKFTQGGKTLYSNVPGDNSAMLSATGQPSAQSQQAATNLSARYADRARGPFTQAAEANNLPAGYGMVLPPTSAESAAPVFDTRGLSKRQIARLQVELAINAANNATSRANTGDTTGVTREGHQLQAGTAAANTELQRQKLGAELPLIGAQTQHQQAQAAQSGAAAQVSIAGLAARQAYAKALESGDPKAVAAAERRIRVLEGKERTQRHLVVPGGQTTNEFGQTTTSPSRVFNQETEQFVAQPEGAATSTKYQTGQVYQDGNGRKALWDGKQFVPQ